MCRRLSCDKRLLAQMNGNSVSGLHSYLLEQHTTDYYNRCTRLLLACSMFKGVPRSHAVSTMPDMERVPGKKWLLATYAREVFCRIDELRAKVTSIFGSILKMDSTKKVRRFYTTARYNILFTKLHKFNKSVILCR